MQIRRSTGVGPRPDPEDRTRLAPGPGAGRGSTQSRRPAQQEDQQQEDSSIPDNAIIVSARLRIQRGTLSGTSPFATHGALWADIRTGGFNNNVALETADFQAPATAAQVVSLSNAIANGAASEGDLNSAGLTAINKTGVTQLRLHFNLDDDNDRGNDYLGYYPIFVMAPQNIAFVQWVVISGRQVWSLHL